MLAVELYGHVRELSSCPHGSEVLQACLEVMKPECCCFIPGELIGHAVTFACHEHGCEVLCRLIEHIIGQEMESLMKELLQHCALLCEDVFGNTVVQHMIEYGSQSHQMHICKVLADGLPSSAQHSAVSTVIDKAMTCACSMARGVLREKMLTPPSGIVQALAKDEAALPSLSCSPALEPNLKEQFPQKTRGLAPNTTVSMLNKTAAEFVPITTLMVRGIPCSYSQEKLLQVFDDLGFQGRYDFFYLPRKGHQSNLGFAFVNFVDMEWAHLCVIALNGHPLDATRSKKVCSACPARIQGLENLKKHFSHTCVAKNPVRGPMFVKNSARRPTFPQVRSSPAIAA